MEIVNFEDLFRVMTYPAGEPHVELRHGNEYKYTPKGNYLNVVAKAFDFNDLCIIRIADDILNRNGYRTSWTIPYLPFARHDRRNHRYDGLELVLAMNILDGIDVSIIDPHSDVSGILPHWHQAAFVNAAMNLGLNNGNPIYAIPDLGASKKAEVWAKAKGLETIQCLKKRNTETGELSGFQVLADDLTDRDVVVVDDICDGGGTFKGLAQELYSKGARNLTLAVTHGLFTKGLGQIEDNYHKIYTLDTCTEESPALVKVPVRDIIKTTGWKI